MARLISNGPPTFRVYERQKDGQIETLRIPLVSITGVFDTNDQMKPVTATFLIEDLTEASIHGQHIHHGGKATARLYHLMDPCSPNVPCKPVEVLETLKMVAEDFVRFYNQLQEWYPVDADLTPLPRLDPTTIDNWRGTAQTVLATLVDNLENAANRLPALALTCCWKPCYSLFISKNPDEIADPLRVDLAHTAALCGSLHFCCA